MRTSTAIPRESPNGEFVANPDALPGNRPEIISVFGAAGVSAAAFGGAWESLTQRADPVKTVATSGGVLAPIFHYAGFNAQQRREISAGAPYSEMGDRPDFDNYSKFNPRKYVDPRGMWNGEKLPEWMGQWLDHSGVNKWKHLELNDADPKLGSHKLTISLSMFESPKPFGKFSQAELDDPRLARRIMAQIAKDGVPWRAVRNIFFPDDVRADLPWLEDDVAEMSIAEVAGWSCRRWPAYRPKLLQNPETLKIVALFDGAMLRGQPNQFNTGRRPPLAMVNLRFGLGDNEDLQAEMNRDQASMPWAMVRRILKPPYGPLDLEKIGPMEADRMYELAMIETNMRLAGHFDDYLSWYNSTEGKLDWLDVHEEQRFHPLRSIFQDPYAGPPTVDNYFTIGLYISDNCRGIVTRQRPESA